jgi:hypothetical protein
MMRKGLFDSSRPKDVMSLIGYVEELLDSEYPISVSRDGQFTDRVTEYRRRLSDAKNSLNSALATKTRMFITNASEDAYRTCVEVVTLLL